MTTESLLYRRPQPEESITMSSSGSPPPTATRWRQLRAALTDPTASATRAAKLLAGIALLVLGLGQISRDLVFGPAFYEAVAQVIPVLLLVAVIEGRFFREHPSAQDFDQRLRRTLLLLVLASEAIALLVIARGDDTMVLRGAVLTGLLCAGAMFVVYAFDGPRTADE